MREPRQSFMTRVRAGDFHPGEQRAYIMSQVLESVAVIFAGIDDPEPAERMGFLAAPTIESAFDLAGDLVGKPASALAVPHALLTMPVVTPSEPSQ